MCAYMDHHSGRRTRKWPHTYTTSGVTSSVNLGMYSITLDIESVYITRGPRIRHKMRRVRGSVRDRPRAELQEVHPAEVEIIKV